jgi:glycosyltransferase involved in cell wall biosynthesis
MKMLFLNPTGAIGGAERVLLSALVATRQAKPQTQCHLLAMSSGPLLERAAELGVQTTILPTPAGLQSFGDSSLSYLSLLWKGVPLAFATWRYVRQLRRLLREIKPDLIHSNGIKTHALLWLAGTRGVPVLWHVHDFLSRRSLARRVLGGAVCQVAGAIAVSNAVADDLRTLWPQLKVKTVANAIDTAAFCPGPADPGLLDRLANLAPRSCLRVGLVATYARWKGQGVFLSAAARVLREHPELPVRFYIIGGPIYQTQGSQFSRAELQTLIRQLGMEINAGLIDFQLDVRPIYRALDVVVHASTLPEPFGLSIIEAMACGKPVIVAQAGGAAEIIHSGDDALGVAPGDESALFGSISKLLHDPTLRSAMGATARSRVCKHYDLVRFGNEWVNLINNFEPQGADERNEPKGFSSSFLHAEH